MDTEGGEDITGVKVFIRREVVHATLEVEISGTQEEIDATFSDVAAAVAEHFPEGGKWQQTAKGVKLRVSESEESTRSEERREAGNV